VVIKVWFAVCCEVIMYTNEELASMHYMYGLADGNAFEVRRLYRERYPTRGLPDRKTFEAIHRLLCEHGSTARPPGTGGRPSTTREEEEHVLNAVDQSPGVSTRRYVPHMRIWRLLQEHQLYPYHLQRVQASSPATMRYESELGGSVTL
jgi:hypothetical protein